MPATITIKNVSPLGDLDVALLRRIVKAGETVTVTKAQAASLLAQPDVWEPVSKSAAALASTPVAAGDAPTETDVESEDQE